MARLIGQSLSERLAQAVLIENRPGAGGKYRDRDGRACAGPTATRCSRVTDRTRSTPRSTTSSISISCATSRRSASISRVPNVMVGESIGSGQDPPEFIAYAKANPGKINYGSAGTGSASHLAGELFKMMAGVDIVHVPYRGAAPALTDLRRRPSAGRLFADARARSNTSGPVIGDALAVTTATRSEALAGPADRGRRSAGLRGEHLVRARRTQECTGRDRRRAQQGDQCEPRRSQDEGPGSPTWAVSWLSQVRRQTSASSSPAKLKNGARWSSSPGRSRTDPPARAVLFASLPRSKAPRAPRGACKMRARRALGGRHETSPP